MKKVLLALVSFGALLTIAGCSSTSSLTYTTSTLGEFTEDRIFSVETFYGTSMDDTRLVNPKDYEVLGPIIVYAKDGDGIKGYSEILEAAIAKYPETSAVINIVKDIAGESQEGIVSKYQDIAWSGIAIKITGTIVDDVTITTTHTTDSNGKEVITETRSATYKKF